MNKKLLAAAVASAVVAAPAAYAEAVIYGKFHNAVELRDNGSDDAWYVQDHASRIGFKGSEDLGGGLKAIYQAEFTVETDGNEGGAAGQDGGDGWGGQRNTFIGLAGNWGTFIVGRRDTPMKSVFYGAGNERLGDSIIDINSGTAGVFTEARVDNAIAYISPSMSGFTVAAAAVPGENQFASADGVADHYSLGAMYKGGGLKASVGYESYDLGSDVDIFQVGATYTFGAFSVGAQYEDTDGASRRNPIAGAGGAQVGDDHERTAWALTGKATFGNNAISLIYTDSEAENAAGTTTSETSGWGIAAEHNFSKRTKVYAAYADNEDDATDTDTDAFALGMIHSF